MNCAVEDMDQIVLRMRHGFVLLESGLGGEEVHPCELQLGHDRQVLHFGVTVEVASNYNAFVHTDQVFDLLINPPLVLHAVRIEIHTQELDTIYHSLH